MQEDFHSHGTTGIPASRYHAQFRSEFSKIRNSNERTRDRDSDPFTEYIEFKVGGGQFWANYFDDFQGPFSDYARMGAGGFRFTGDPGGGDYTGTYFTEDHATGSASTAVCGETQQHLDVLGLAEVPSCKSKLKQVLLLRLVLICFCKLPSVVVLLAPICGCGILTCYR